MYLSKPHVDVNLQIAGYDGSTSIGPLAQALGSLNISAVLPGLTSRLLDSASLVVLNSTGHGNNITHVSVSLANPFSAALAISKVSSKVTYQGVTLGQISSTDSWTANGKSATNSPELNMDLNMDPSSLFTVTKVLAHNAGLDTAALDGLVALGGYQYVPTSGNTKRALVTRDNLYTYVISPAAWFWFVVLITVFYTADSISSLSSTPRSRGSSPMLNWTPL